jgi:hypothetical protein
VLLLHHRCVRVFIPSNALFVIHGASFTFSVCTQLLRLLTVNTSASSTASVTASAASRFAEAALLHRDGCGPSFSAREAVHSAFSIVGGEEGFPSHWKASPCGFGIDSVLQTVERISQQAGCNYEAAAYLLVEALLTYHSSGLHAIMSVRRHTLCQLRKAPSDLLMAMEKVLASRVIAGSPPNVQTTPHSPLFASLVHCAAPLPNAPLVSRSACKISVDSDSSDSFLSSERCHECRCN